MAELTLLGYRYSVYTRVVRMMLAETGLQATFRETDPFADDVDPVLRRANPMIRVPVLTHGDFTLYETAAITRYLDRVAPGPSLVPADPKAAARMQQIIGIVDSDIYPVLVRQVYSHAVFRPAFGAPSDPGKLAAGLAAAPRLLGVLDAFAAEGLQLAPDRLSLADFHLAPMIDAFAACPEGSRLLDAHGNLGAWFARIAERDSFHATKVALPGS